MVSDEQKRLKDGMPKGRIAADFKVRGSKGNNKNGVCKDAERQRVRGLESPSVFKSPSSRRPYGLTDSYSTGLKTRGYLNSRLSDAFSVYCHAELVSASHCEPFLVLLRGQILKQVIRLLSSKTSYIF